MYKTSEWVSTGHPDKLADYISSFILDRYLERDPMTRYALEVQIKDNFVTLGGEITSTASFTPAELEQFVKIAVNEVGYTRAYQKKFGAENTICGDDLIVTQHISRQSPDIARGVDNLGWGDQGIFFGMAVNSPKTDYMPPDWWLARKIGKHIYDTRYAGIDIKTQVTMNDRKVEEIVVAVPMTEKHFDYDVANMVKFCCGGSRDFALHINGTGKFLRHGPLGDCGTTGRKLAVDFYGGNCKIGGGAVFGKDGTKADLSLNLLARKKALDYIRIHPGQSEVHCAISCRIGSPEIFVVLTDWQGNELMSYHENLPPDKVIELFQLRTPHFAKMCRDGLFA